MEAEVFYLSLTVARVAPRRSNADPQVSTGWHRTNADLPTMSGLVPVGATPAHGVLSRFLVRIFRPDIFTET